VDQRTRQQRRSEAAFDEAFRSLRTRILLGARESQLRTILVTGAVGGSGKTTVALSLAESLAQSGRRVILVDSDMRRPNLHTVYGAPNDIGLSSILAEGVSDDDALHQTEIEGLFLLFSGPSVGDVPRFLQSEAMLALVQRLRERADFVIFDSPPVAACADGVILGELVDGVVLVVSAGRIPRGTEKATVRQLQAAGANILGVCLNRVQPEHSDEIYHYSRYYSDSEATPASRG